jgi:hypothetical protein
MYLRHIFGYFCHDGGFTSALSENIFINVEGVYLELQSH